jgi:hypothetical protein
MFLNIKKITYKLESGDIGHRNNEKVFKCF